MDDLTEKLQGVQDRLDLGLAPDRVERLQAGFGKRVSFRKRARRAAVALGGALALVAVVFTTRLLLQSAQPSTAALGRSDVSASFAMADGSRVAKLDELSIVRVQEASATRSLIELVRGGARFDVTHQASRQFKVLAGPVAVEVLGTEFTVERIGPRVRVSVLRGRVRVLWSGQLAYVAEGETGMFPRTEPEPSALGSVAAPNAALLPGTAPESDAAEPPAAATTAWRQLAKDRKFVEARSALEQSGWSVPSNATDLLLAADVARQSNAPVKAVPLLKRVVAEFPGDPRASAAAFTLGKTLMALGSAKEAAQAYGRAGALDKGGAISEDALAREVEAWAQAGDTARAKQRAQAYVSRYPAGLRLESVRRYGRL